ncbi:putative MO25-like protein [Hordeum vulgare]|nr:putative MO25-like protein [Hordeum vulgare]
MGRLSTSMTKTTLLIKAMLSIPMRYKAKMVAGNMVSKKKKKRSMPIEDNEDIYCDSEEEEVSISDEPLIFIDERTQRIEAQRRGKSIRTESYNKDEDPLI